MDPDGWWKINLQTADERAIVEMLVYLAVAEPGENWLGEQFGDKPDKLVGFFLHFLLKCTKKGAISAFSY